MKGFIQVVDRQQATLLPEYLDDWVDESNPVRAVDVFVDALELRDLGFDGVDPAATGRPGYHPSAMLKACASTSEASANTSPPSQKHEIFLGEEEISDVSLATFYVFDKENAGPPPLFQKLRLAAGCGAGCGCSFGCAYWPQPPQPPKATQPTQHRKKKPPHRTN